MKPQGNHEQKLFLEKTVRPAIRYGPDSLFGPQMAFTTLAGTSDDSHEGAVAISDLPEPVAVSRDGNGAHEFAATGLAVHRSSAVAHAALTVDSVE